MDVIPAQLTALRAVPIPYEVYEAGDKPGGYDDAHRMALAARLNDDGFEVVSALACPDADGLTHVVRHAAPGGAGGYYLASVRGRR